MDMRVGDELINGFSTLKLRILIQFIIDRNAWDDLVQRTKPMYGRSIRRIKISDKV
jgi:hypothetical protein